MLFDSLVKPILLYGSDFWGCLKTPQNNPVENLHMQFCRQILGVQKNTTNNGVLLELGRTPLMLEAQRLSLKNWDRIKSGNGNTLVTNSYHNAHIMKLDWNETVCSLLSKHGMHYRITESQSDLGNAFFGKAKDIFHQEVFAQISDPKSKLRTYALIKESIGREDYLKDIRNTKHRQMLTKLRLSNHRLMIELGRHKKLPKEERVCQICHGGIEDEIHFMTKCRPLEKLREPLIASCYEIRPHFGYFSDEEKYIFLMTTPLLMGNVSKFVYSAFKERELIIDVSTTVDDMITKISSSPF